MNIFALIWRILSLLLVHCYFEPQLGGCNIVNGFLGAPILLIQYNFNQLLHSLNLRQLSIDYDFSEMKGFYLR